MIVPALLWRAEWLKTTRQPFNRILLFIVLVFLVVLLTLTFLGGLARPERYLDFARELLPFPSSLTTIAQFGVAAGQLASAVFMANSVGHEYTRDTWKMILPRYGSRAAFLSAKVGVGITVMLIALMLLLAIGVPISLAWAAILGLEPTALAPGAIAERALGTLAAMLPMLLYGITALLVTVITRSTVAGAFVAFFGLQTIAICAPGFGRFAILMPYPHMYNITERWASRDPELLARVSGWLGGPTSPWLSCAVIIGYSAALLLAAFAVFERRDLTGE
jgi:ABC-type transport system involved in multi-copper enzyme maturation permease subunit